MDPLTAINLLRATCAASGYAFFEDGDFDLNLFGLRSTRPFDNTFDDTFVVAYKDGGAWQLRRWAFTSDPGKAAILNPQNKDGCAILIPNQYRGAYHFGAHKGQYRCLVPKSTLPVWRDNDRDALLERGGPVHAGYFIQVHHAGPDSKFVDNWSEGCQVFKRIAEFEEFLALCDRQAARGPGWGSFTYTLFDLGFHPELAPLAFYP
ncbi:MAG: hypothetical protein ACOZNI_19970 [Myxococcota bacterium]